MNRPPMRPRRRARWACLMRVVNAPMRRLLRLPFRTPLNRRLMLLTFTGRKTGRVYRQPVSYVPDGDTLLTPAGGRWKLNLREGQPIRVRLGGRECSRDPSSSGTPTRSNGRSALRPGP
jgi:F420H(2)-dependent quinone reductase